MSLKSIASKILPVAKVLGTALAGPAGPVVNMALSAVGAALGVEPTRPAIEAALETDPEALVKLRTAEIAFDTRMAELKVDVFEIAAKDVQDARSMAKVNMWPQITLSVVFIVGYFGLVFGLISGNWAIPEGSDGQIIAGLILVLTTGVTGIMGFWFGSSFGSKMKVSPPPTGAK
jgi:hypothetical protein